MEKTPIIELHNISRVYPLYNKPVDRLKELFFRRSYHKTFEALKNINLTVFKGESLGIIGDNGAGKSTLLQIIAGTISPSAGKVKSNGKILAILELGIGFHPELTGRENVFNYAQLLGYENSFVESCFDEICSFSELGDFINQPVKTYSSGMQMRLAFSLVANLKPDVLIIDEALAVGDVSFQKKCIDKIIEYKESGGTLLFCSHALYQVSRVSSRVIWLDKGMIRMEGEPESVISAYEWYSLEREREQNSQEFLVNEEAPDTMVKIVDFRLIEREGLKRGSDIVFEIKTKASSKDIGYHVAVSIKVPTGWGVYVAATHFDEMDPLRGDRTVVLRFPEVPLLGGHYFAVARVLDDTGLMLYDEKQLDYFTLQKKHGEIGTCYLEHSWSVS